jgi:putative phosphoesterase
MKTIGLLSDTHTFLHHGTADFFEKCDEIWHAGDIGNLDCLEKLSALKPVRAVYGNIDGQEIRMRVPQTQFFQVENRKILMTHIGGKPGKYDPEAKKLIINSKPDIFICGHSHICKVQFDAKNNLMYINPGAAGKYGFHLKITLLRFEINDTLLQNMEILEINK